MLEKVKAAINVEIKEWAEVTQFGFSGAPQSPQNFLPSALAAWHRGHCIE